MKRAFPSSLAALVCLVGFAWAQNVPTPVPTPGLQEPENHTIVVDQLMRYHDSGEYEREIREVVNSARDYLESQYPGRVPEDRKLAAVFDIDETALSNWDVMAYCGFCSYDTQQRLYKDGKDKECKDNEKRYREKDDDKQKWFSMAHAPAITPVLELFNFAREKGIAVFFVTGRPECQREMTVANLLEAKYSGWVDLLMQDDPSRPPAHVLKPRKRDEIESRGYKIVLNIGDQASDLSGCCALRVFKLPNPYYLLP